ncbi:MAG: DEAD/DEAH box helicase [Pirellulaceae bacterium]
MFDDYSKSLFSDVPEFDGLVQDDTARALSAAYLAITSARINGVAEVSEDLDYAQPQLRRIANTLIFHVVLDDERDSVERQAAAFVAAEAIALMAEYLTIATEQSDTERDKAIRAAERFARVESSLLYMFARYDACSGGVIRGLSSSETDDQSLVDLAAEWCFEQMNRLGSLQLFDLPPKEFPYMFSDADDLGPRELEEDTVSRLFVELGTATNEFCSWLSGSQKQLESTISRLDSLIDVLAIEKPSADSLFGYEYSRIYHLAVLARICFPSIGKRSLVHVVPTPPNGDDEAYRSYLLTRAVGSKSSAGRPVLWPSAMEFVRECLAGDNRHCIASMPTGSGKSFVAELAVSQAVQDGWVLYLAPTNALTEQIRTDLSTGLASLDTEIVPFIGDHEYSIFSTDRVAQMNTNSVAVMTPEKCSLALRLSPEVFSNCSLVVFDECHLIGESSSRGPVAEIVLTQLMMRAEECRFLLMSAIVQNPDDLAEWLNEATGEDSTALSIKWRPTRTLRAVLGVDNESVQAKASDAIKSLKGKNKRYKKKKFKSDYSMASNLQGAWQSDQRENYALTRINCLASLTLIRARNPVTGKWKYTWDGDSWVNQSAIAVSRLLAISGVQTLVFTPANKHYPFNNGPKIDLPEELLKDLPEQQSIVATCRFLAKFELGDESQVFDLLDKGIAVHTSLMLETEKIAVESAFRGRSSPIMFATGTLAQGLNLPAVAVIIAGSKIGDTRGEASADVKRRKFSQLLNAAGRAGRAGFANQGFVIAVPDHPVAFDQFDSIEQARNQVDYLQQSDNAVPVRSGLESFLDDVAEQSLRSDQASDTELQIISVLGGGGEEQLELQPILNSTFAAYLRRKNGEANITKKQAERVSKIGTEFIESTGAPAWLTIAAQRAGLDFFLTLAISRSWAAVRPNLSSEMGNWTVADWLNELLEIVFRIPPGLLGQHMPASKLKFISREFKAYEKQFEFFTNRDLDWQPTKDWQTAWATAKKPLELWMNGDTIKQIASVVSEASLDEIGVERTGGKPIPKALAVSHGAWSSLALVAGGFLAVAEQVFNDEVPLALASLPMCIKYGCNSPGSLAWFRFGVRLRRPSHHLANRFPAPDGLSDEQLKDWVRKARRSWLQSGEDWDETSTVIRDFITQ